MTGSGVRASVTERTKRTWDGVFLPVSLSIFGFVLFARLPWMVGECGVWLTLGGIVICFAVTFFTTISLAAISTNGFTGDGGPYMMIARCLGPQIGTTVGITFVLANSVATAMYLVGGSELIVSTLDTGIISEWYQENPYLVTLVVSSFMLLLLLLIAFLKVEKMFRVVCLALTLISVVDVIVYILRVQNPEVPYNPATPSPLPPTTTVTPTPGASSSLLFVSSGVAAGGGGGWNGQENNNTTSSPSPLFEGFTGLSMSTFRNNWAPAFSSSSDFQRALAVLFPGVSGLMSGVCLSGDLKNGAKAIPRGIGYAWSLSFATYIIMAVLVGGSMERTVLRTRYDALRRGASDTYIFAPGEFVASFAAGLSMMVGSARVLRAIARDRLLPFGVLQRLADASTRHVTLIYWGMIQLILLIGNTYTDASVVAAQVFCANFLALNLSTFLSSVTGIVSFRPVYAFFNTTTALCGAFLCAVVMFFINPLVAIGVLIFMALILVIADMYIDPSKVSWGDASQPLVFYIVRKWLLRLDERKEHIRHWRPSILHVVTDPLCSLNLVHVTNNLKKGGLYELCLVLEGSFHDTIAPCFQWKGWLMDFISTSGIKAFAVVTCGETLRGATQGMLRTCGLGGMRPNTVLLSLDEILQREYFHHIYDSYCATGSSGSQSNFGNVNNNAAPTHEAYKATLGGATQDTFGTVRPLKDVNNRATEFWDLKRDTKGNVISTKGATGSGGLALKKEHSIDFEESVDEREPLIATTSKRRDYAKSMPALSSTAIPTNKRDSGLLAPPSPTLLRGTQRDSLNNNAGSSSSFVGGRAGSLLLTGRSSFAVKSTRASAAMMLDPADDADELAHTMALEPTARHQQRAYVNRAVHFAEFDHMMPPPPDPSSPMRPVSPEIRCQSTTTDYTSRFLSATHAAAAAVCSGDEHNHDNDDAQHQHITCVCQSSSSLRRVDHMMPNPSPPMRPVSPEIRRQSTTTDYTSRFLSATHAAHRSGDEHNHDDDDAQHQHIAFSLTRTAFSLLNSTMNNGRNPSAAAASTMLGGTLRTSDEPLPSLPITRTATAIFNEQLKKRRVGNQPPHRPLGVQRSSLSASPPQGGGVGASSNHPGVPVPAVFASSVQSTHGAWIPLTKPTRSSPRHAPEAASWSAHAVSSTSDNPVPIATDEVAEAMRGPPSGEGGILLDEFGAVANIMTSEASDMGDIDIPLVQSFAVGEDFPEVMSVASTGGAGGLLRSADGQDTSFSPHRATSGDPLHCDDAPHASQQNSVIHATLLRLLHEKKQHDADGPVALHADGPEVKTREGFATWLEKTMQGSFAYRPNQQKRSTLPPRAAPPPPPTLQATPTTATTDSSSRSMKMAINGSNAALATPPSSSSVFPPPLPTTAPTSTVDSTVKFLEDAMAKAHEMKVPFGWGLFRAPHTFESKVVEQQLLERMIAQRHATRLTGEPDLCSYADITEFCSIARDVSLMQMNLLLARNMDKLNMAELTDNSKRNEVFVDVWVPHDSDAILFLLSYCFSPRGGTEWWKDCNDICACGVLHGTRRGIGARRRLCCRRSVRRLVR
ncbi:amino acid permease, putative [Bodo saltans]|uniref:Amino acid permease, putative n=1 Tax=Bodo saltans TaxID=75058 RepID=A0A0S4IRX2_BODSA|nr:amino acid permease, putative [Bodo saltans]|eukprot:CUE70944.1 amino acid permease, putative [Bodo saltans]